MSALLAPASLRALGLVTATTVVVGLVALDADTAVRAPLALAWILVAPGLALTPLLGLRDGLAELVLAVAVSVALATVVATFAVYVGAWSPGGVLAVLGAVTLGGAVAQLWEPPRARGERA